MSVEREIRFERGVMTIPLSMWRSSGAAWVLDLEKLATLGPPKNLPPDPNPLPRFHLFRRGSTPQ